MTVLRDAERAAQPDAKVEAPRREGSRPSSAVKGLWGQLIGGRPLGFLLILVLIGAWVLADITMTDRPVSWPKFADVAIRLFELIATGEIVDVMAPSIFRLAVGFLVAVVVGVMLGVAMGMIRRIYFLMEPLTELFRPIPGAAIVPAAILLLGLGDSMKIAVIAFSSVFPVLINTYGGVRSVDPIQIDTARTLGLTKRQIARHVVLPAAAPYIFAGMRISLAVALILVIVTEMLTGGGGLGYYILSSQRVFKVPETYVGIIVVAIFGYLLNRGFIWLQNRLLSWHATMGGEVQ